MRPRSKLAVWALVLALLPYALYVLGFFASFAIASGGESEVFPIFGVLGMVPLGAPIAAIALGIAARRDAAISSRDRSLAFAAILIGSITLGLYVLAFVLFLIVLATCAAACGSASSSGNSCVAASAAVAPVPCAVAGTTTGFLPTGRRLRDALAHHPDLPALRADVFRVGQWRLCVGCFTLYPVLAAAWLATWMWPVPAAAAWAAGLPLVAVQTISALGWTRWRWLKIGVKASLGVGLALVARAVLAAPWPEFAQLLFLTGMVLLALASARPRLARIAHLEAASSWATP